MEEKDPKLKVRNAKAAAGKIFEEWNGIDEDTMDLVGSDDDENDNNDKDQNKNHIDSDSDSDSDSDNSDIDRDQQYGEKGQKNHNNEQQDSDASDFEIVPHEKEETQYGKQKNKNSIIFLVIFLISLVHFYFCYCLWKIIISPPFFCFIEDFVIDDPVKYTLAQQMLSQKGKRDLMDNGFNRRSFHDEPGLPKW